MWKSPPPSSLTHSPASSTSAAGPGYPPRRPSRDPSPPAAGAGYDRGRYVGGGGGYRPASPTTAYNAYETARRGGGDRRPDRHGFDDLDDEPPGPTLDRRQYYSHARSPSPPRPLPSTTVPRSPRPVYDDRGVDDSPGGNGLAWQPRPRRPSARPAGADADDESAYDRYRSLQQRNGSFSAAAMSPRSVPVAGLSPSQLRPGQVYPRDAEAEESPRFPSATLGRQPSFSRQPQEPISPMVMPATPDAGSTLKGSTEKKEDKKQKRGCMDWTRWLLAGSIARFIMAVCLVVLGLHSFMCGGGAMFLLVIIPIAGWSADGSLSIFGFRVSPPTAPPAPSAPSSSALDVPSVLTVLGVFLLVGVVVDLVSTFAAFKLAHRKLPGLVTLGLAEVTQVARVVLLVLMINRAKNTAGWEQKSETLAWVFIGVEIVQLIAAAALFVMARWRWSEKQKFEGTTASNTNMMSSSSSTLASDAHRPSDVEMQKPGFTATTDPQHGQAKSKMRFNW